MTKTKVMGSISNLQIHFSNNMINNIIDRYVRSFFLIIKQFNVSPMLLL